MKDFLWTCSFLTVVPVNRKYHDVPNIRNVLFWFPIVGLLIGVSLAVSYFLFVKIIPFAVVDSLILILYFFVTGGLHLDGFADTCDGIFGGKDREKRLRIMRDSAIGSFGVTGLICLIGLRYLCFHSVCDDKLISAPFFIDFQNLFLSFDTAQITVLQKCVILSLMPLMGRWTQTLGASLSRYAREGELGTGLIIVQDSRFRYSFFSAIIPFVLISYFCGIKGLIAFVLIIIFTLFFIRFTKLKIGGMTGDTLGTLSELSELIFVGMFLL